MRKQFNDKFVVVSAADVTASASNNGTANAEEFVVGACYSPTILAKVQAIGNNKTIAFKLQDRDSATDSWQDVPSGVQTDADESDVSEAGYQSFYYAGQKERVRLVVVSTSASPAATVRVTYVRHSLFENPQNASL